MAIGGTDALLFPAGIKFDKTGGVSDKDIKDILGYIQTKINKNELWVKLRIDPKSKTFLDNYGKSAGELDNKLKSVAQAIERLQKANLYWRSSGTGMTNEAKRLTQMYHELSILRKNSSLTAAEFEKMLVKMIKEEARERERATKAADKQAQADERRRQQLVKTNSELSKHSDHLRNIVRRMAAYASVGAIGAFLTQVREVTAQFELQRVALGAIIQDQVRANSLFAEIKSFALKSPVKILDLTKYVKQLAAYRIETDKLFDTTKRLADVAVGLGGDGIMERLILAYGETKASHALNAKELRQYAMMGIPMLELLSKKLTEIKGKAIDTHETFQMIKKRLVEFDVVKQVFEDMTNEGGTFYDMQEKQGNTLYGLWAKLGDAASVMYDQIGNTGVVNSAMKQTIELLSATMRNWRDVGRGILEVATAFGVYKLAVMLSNKATALSIAWNKKDIALRAMHIKTLTAQSWSLRTFNALLLKSRVSAEAASRATFIFSRALSTIRGAIAKTGIGALVIGLGYLVDRLIFGKTAAQELKETLASIRMESANEQDKSVANFERLANVVVSSQSTYKEQQKALEELRRTYSDIIPVERLTIENLKAMNGHYDVLTSSIRRYIEERMKQKAIDEITDTYARDIIKLQRKINDDLKDKYSYEQLNEFWERFTENVKDAAKTAGMATAEIINMTTQEMGASLEMAHDIGSSWTLFDTFHVDADKLRRLIQEQEKEIEALDRTYSKDAMAMAEYADSYKEMVDNIEKNGVRLNGILLNKDDNPLIYSQQAGNLEIKDAMIPTIKEAFEAAGVAFDEGWVSIIENIDKNMPQVLSTIDFSALDESLTEQSDKLLADIQAKLEELIAKRQAYLNIIATEEKKGKGGSQEAIDYYKNLDKQLGEQIQKLEERARKITVLPGLIDKLKSKYNELVPSDSVVKMMRQKFDSIVDYTKEYAKNMRAFRMNADEDMKAYRKRLEDEVELIKNNIKAWAAAQVIARSFRNKTEEQNLQNLIDEAKLQLADLEKMLDSMPVFEKGKGGAKSDPRLQILNNIASTMEKINKEYDDLLKKEGETKALADTQRLFAEELANIQKIASKHGFKLPAFEVPKNASDVAKWYKSVADEIRRLKLKDADKILIDLGYKEGKVDIDEMQRKLEQKLKELSERIAQSKTAREFYDKILTQTGDVDIAASVTMSIYGDTGEGLFEQTIAQIREVFASGVEGVNIPIDTAFDMTNQVIDYGKLAKIYEQYQDQLIEANKSTAEKIVSEGQKTAAQNVLTWQKELEKAKDFEEQRTDILNRETQRRAEIIKSNIPQEMKDQLIQLSYDKQAKDIAGVNVKEFQASEDYIKIFENLDRVSTNALKRLRTNLAEIIKQNKDLDPENMKQLVKALEQLDNQIEGRGFGNTMIAGIKEYFQSFKKLKDAQVALSQARSEYAEKELALNAQIEVAETNHLLAIDELNKLRADGLATDEQIKAAELAVNEAAKKVAQAKEKQAKAAKKVKDAEQGVTDAEDEQLEGAEKFKADMGKLKQITDQFASALGDVKDLLGLAEDSAAGVAFDSAIEGLERMSKIYGLIITLQEIYNAVTNSNPWMAIAAAVLTVASILGSWISNEKVRAANKEIERQEKLLHSLEYSYDRLQKAQEKLFGSDYISNYNQQLEILNAEADAYYKQWEAEKSKGKKADEDAMQDYMDSYTERLNEIKDRRDELQEYFLGTDLTSAARDWAKSWLEARWSFEDTTEAMKENFADMVQNMIVESMAAKIMESALGPVFEAIDKLSKDGALSADDIAEIAELGVTAIDRAGSSMEGMLAALEQAGVDLSGVFAQGESELTGISRNIATASEESINGLAQNMNVFSYYVSYVPTISENVAQIRLIMEGGAAMTLGAGAGTDLMSLQNEHLSQLPVIAANTLATAERCERAAVACEEMRDTIARIVGVKGNKTVINTTMY